MWGYCQCRLLDPSNNLHIHTYALQAEEDKKSMGRMQTLMDNLQLKAQSYKQQIEAAVSTWGSCNLTDFLVICFWLMEISSPELGEQLYREDQLSLKSAHSLVFLKQQLSPMVKFCAVFLSMEQSFLPWPCFYTQTCAVQEVSNNA